MRANSRIFALCVVLGVGLLIAPLPLRAQGCAQCKESVSQTSGRTQQAYRRGIAVLILAVAVLGGGTFFAVRRFR